MAEKIGPDDLVHNSTVIADLAKELGDEFSEFVAQYSFAMLTGNKDLMSTMFAKAMLLVLTMTVIRTYGQIDEHVRRSVLSGFDDNLNVMLRYLESKGFRFADACKPPAATTSDPPVPSFMS